MNLKENVFLHRHSGKIILIYAGVMHYYFATLILSLTRSTELCDDGATFAFACRSSTPNVVFRSCRRDSVSNGSRLFSPVRWSTQIIPQRLHNFSTWKYAAFLRVSSHWPKAKASANESPKHTFFIYTNGFVYIRAKAKVTSFSNGFIENPIQCSHWAATNIKEKIRFQVRFV